MHLQAGIITTALHNIIIIKGLNILWSVASAITGKPSPSGRSEYPVLLLHTVLPNNQLQHWIAEMKLGPNTALNEKQNSEHQRSPEGGVRISHMGQHNYVSISLQTEHLTQSAKCFRQASSANTGRQSNWGLHFLNFLNINLNWSIN